MPPIAEPPTGGPGQLLFGDPLQQQAILELIRRMRLAGQATDAGPMVPTPGGPMPGAPGLGPLVPGSAAPDPMPAADPGAYETAGWGTAPEFDWGAYQRQVAARRKAARAMQSPTRRGMGDFPAAPMAPPARRGMGDFPAGPHHPGPGPGPSPWDIAPHNWDPQPRRIRKFPRIPPNWQSMGGTPYRVGGRY